MRKCKCGCGKSIEHKHPNAKFYNQRHKDRYWNWENPRGKFAYLKNIDEIDMDEIENEMHPLDSYSLGQE